MDNQSTTPNKIAWNEFQIALPVASTFIALFIVLQRTGVLNFLQVKGNVSYGAAFLIGVIASLSTCMAMVGGLILSMSANMAKDKSTAKPHILFHVGRIISFFVFGGIISVLGSGLHIGQTSTLVLSLFVGLVMLTLGLNLLDIFPWLENVQPTAPSSIKNYVLKLKKFSNSYIPFVVGVLTFFLPCGFTQSMQIYSLSLGDFWLGAMTMFSFALGTLPVLALLSFGATGFNYKVQSGTFWKTAGLVVIFFALVNIISALSGAGLIPPIFNL